MKMLFRALLAALDLRRLFLGSIPGRTGGNTTPLPAVVLVASPEPDEFVQRLREAGM